MLRKLISHATFKAPGRLHKTTKTASVFQVDASLQERVHPALNPDQRPSGGRLRLSARDPKPVDVGNPSVLHWRFHFADRVL